MSRDLEVIKWRLDALEALMIAVAVKVDIPKSSLDLFQKLREAADSLEKL